MAVNAAAMILSAAYGLFFRLFILHSRGPDSAVWIMSIGFLFGVPFTMGFVDVTTRCQLLRSLKASPPPIAYWIFSPWQATIFAMLVAALFAWEGSICLFFATPVMLVMASLGGVTAGITQRRRFRPISLSAVALLPVILMMLETRVPNSDSTRIVTTSIMIHAPASAVWQNIIRVHAITPQELPNSWVREIGFPRPVKATLSHEGVGGVREASFTGGLIFTETIDHWDVLRDLSFSIHANTDSIPPTTLDEHVKVGGQYFDVLEGQYQLKAQPRGNTLLLLTSRERVSTHFNAYAGVWTDAVMRSIQNSILQVICHRAENTTIPMATVQ